MSFFYRLQMYFKTCFFNHLSVQTIAQNARLAWLLLSCQCQLECIKIRFDWYGAENYMSIWNEIFIPLNRLQKL